jgi:hypothetical protein
VVVAAPRVVAPAPDPPAPPPVVHAPPPVVSTVSAPSVPKPSAARPLASPSDVWVRAPLPAARQPSVSVVKFDLDVGEVDLVYVPNFHPFRRRAGHLLIVFLILGVIGAIVATILSYQLNV